jgi:hypothetical protein
MREKKVDVAQLARQELTRARRAQLAAARFHQRYPPPPAAPAACTTCSQRLPPKCFR